MELNSAQLIDAMRELMAEDQPHDDLDNERILSKLLDSEIELQGLMPWSSNYTFLISLSQNEADKKDSLAIYKPCQGERPLWDFPDGKLCHREFASYVISEVLGWPRIPPTVLRGDAPHGQGTVQYFIEADYDAHYFNLRDNTALSETFREIALFDHIINNADRKGGHCLLDNEEQIWAIDHGLTFHTDYKLRTVIWEYCNDPIPGNMVQDLERLRSLLDQPRLCRLLDQLISASEIQAFGDRIDLLLSKGYLPRLHHGRNVPYPPI